MKHFLRLLFLPVLLAVPAKSNLHTIATITGAGATVQISSLTVQASFIQIIADSTNSAAVYFGDSTTVNGTGLRIAAGGGYNTPACDRCVYTPASHYVYVALNDKVYVAWGD